MTRFSKKEKATASVPSRRGFIFPLFSRTAFTLIEMIIVVSIISVLLALLYGALERAKKFSQRAIAYTEIKNIEGAFKQYKAFYHRWPTNSVATVRLSSVSGNGGEDTGFVLDERIAKLLRGINENDSEDGRRFNPEMISFMEFARFRNGAPVNPFPQGTATEDARKYKILFDTNGDRRLFIEDSDLSGFSTNIIGEIAVWTLLPGTRKGVGSQEDTTKTVNDELLGSWDSFGVK